MSHKNVSNAKVMSGKGGENHEYFQITHATSSCQGHTYHPYYEPSSYYIETAIISCSDPTPATQLYAHIAPLYQVMISPPPLEGLPRLPL